MFRLTCFFFIISSCLFGQEQHKANQILFHQGTRTLAVFANPDLEGVTGDMLFLKGAFGMVVKPRMELRLSANYSTIEDIAPGEKDYRFRAVDIEGLYHFEGDSKWIPYIGFSLGYASLNYLEIHDGAFVYGATSGLQHKINKQTFLDLEVQFRSSSKDVFVNDFVPESTDLLTTIGLKVVF